MAERKKMNRLKILSFNMHKGFSAANRRFVLHDMKDEIERHGADLVFLQEVQGENRRLGNRIRNWPNLSQFEFLADKMWPHTAYGKNALYDDGHHGNAILSRHPFESWENIDISSSSLERRGILHGVVRVEQGSLKCPPLHVLCIHLSLLESDRMSQIRTLARRIQDHIPSDEPIILAGDFNDWRQSASAILSKESRLDEAFLSLHGRHAKTFPSFMPVLRLDRVYTRGCRIFSANTLREQPWDSLSDHLGLEVELGF
jgi:endonuclease/exonuclease/phosphatase family metal-dependent hydrolase